MAYPHEVLRMTFGGDIFGGLDEWACSMHIGNPTQATSWERIANSETAKTEIVNALKAWFISPNSQISNVSNLRWVKFALIGVDGKYATSGTDAYTYVEVIDFTPVNGGNSSTIAPQLSLVHSLETGAVRGLAKSGRIYPPTSGSIQPSGYAGGTTSAATSFKTLLSEINGDIANLNPEGGVHDQIVVASKEREGAIRLVQTVRVGNVIDTQRKRRNNFVETYATGDVIVYPENADDTPNTAG